MAGIKIILFLVILFVLVPSGVFAADINSTSYRHNVVISAGSENMTSPSYKMGVVSGVISKVINSSSYINRIGFFYTWKLANEQPCTSADQCEGGFCCSSLCKSSSCPSGDSSPAPSGGGAAAGGGGGGGGPLPTPIEEPKTKDFSVSPGSIKESVALGAAKMVAIAIKNTGNTALEASLNVAAISDFVFLSDTGFSLEAGKEKIIEANIVGKRLGSFIGEIEVTAGGIKKSVEVIIEVESGQVLFDAKIDIPPGYKEVEAGGELKAQITLLNVGPPRKVDVTVTYIIKDRQGNAVYDESETFAVETQASFTKSFKIPQNLKAGEYLAITEVRYENSFAVSSELFSIVPKEAGAAQKAVKLNTAVIFALVVLGVVALFVYLLMPKIKILKKRKPIFKKRKLKRGRKRAKR